MKPSPVLLTALIWVLGATAPILADSPPSDRLGLVGRDQILWIYDHALDTESDLLLLSFGVRSSTDGLFRGLGLLRGLRGKVHCAVIEGNDLHVFYDEGSHRRYSFVKGRISGHTERPLPDGQKPRALAADTVSPSIYAVVTFKAAKEVWRQQAQRALDESEADLNANDNQSPQPVEFESIFTETRFAMVRYDRNLWEVVGSIPTWFDDQQDCRIVVDSSGALHLLFSLGTGAPYQYSRLENGVWDPPATVTRDAGLRILTFFAWDHQLLALFQKQSVGQAMLLTLRHDQSGWATADPPLLGDDFGELDILQLSAAPFTGTIAMAMVDSQDRVWCGRWPVDGGSAVEPLQEVLALRRRGGSTMTLQAQSFIAFGVLAVLLGFVFWRRQDSIVGELVLPAQYRIAGMWRRLAGFVMDVSPCAMLTLWWWWLPVKEWYLSVEYGGGQTPPLSDEILLGWFISCAVYTLYCTVCEVLFGTTPGKMAVQCRVAGEDGHRCRFGQVLLRNALRFVELFPLFQFWPTIILLFFSRNRQRLGDLMARTIVVERVHPSRRRAQSPPSGPQDDGSSPTE